MNGIYGRAATGLQDSSWAVNESVAKIGARGEQKTEALLNGFGKKAAVLHDLRIPIPGFKANIDHAIVSGKSVLLMDSKMWKPGFYWSLLGYRRGWEKTPHIGKSQEYVSRAMNSFLQGTGARVLTPRLVVWSSRDGQPLSTWMLTVPGAEVVNGLRIVPAVKSFVREGSADPAIVRKLQELLVKAPAATKPAPHWSDADQFKTPVRPARVDVYADDNPFA
ncbi:NERD domain protein (plasmid) [Pseudarthrobacter chlorophenolicus A6]|uniref:NERD domain protein n=1 Tax=Pseudarthrobacter chlorophenolicus (strain ATCC 700700 / DSM 12829 / CIP 107037 / JCM 12360 / KCTC 9906 / NCIMB 13794 / A6) TaxID=452863 RepID=B8HID6_PSECP|nr:nuclease-related domain-containing protein [Pseudarthrobacter chlorophenolicus]ACL42183.1 NERD domain protein [Pseudarthrobacter chlorophenolicus A6]SDQ14542.1 Nuclease-related domain-containing protein [Pseudarthrobacter chlorophenolicus]